MRKFVPIEDRVVIKVRKATDTNMHGIYIPGSIAPPPVEGEVVAVGPGRVTTTGVLVLPVVKEGDIVIYGNSNNTYSATEISDGDNEYLIMRETDLLTVVEEVDVKAN